MNNQVLKLPLYARMFIFLIGIFVLLTMLYIAQDIIIPFLFSIIIAIVLHPVVNLLVRWRINRVVAIIITLLSALLVFAILGTLLFSKAIGFKESLPKLVDRFTEIFNQTIHWASGYFDISSSKINVWILKTKDEIISNKSAEIGQTIASLGIGVMVLFLIPVYIFMILFYKPHLLEFFRKLFGQSNRKEVSEVITQIKSIIQSYLTGLLLETAIIATLYSVGLSILGIDYPIVLGVIGAFLNLIPYIGAIIAASLPMMIAIVSKASPWFSLLVLGLYVLIQFIDNNYILPKLVASKVKLNALVSIIAVIGFAALWGIPGMVLSIPLTAIVKLIFDHIEPLKPWGFLLGDEMPPSKKILKSR